MRPVEKRPTGDPGESGHRMKRQMQRRGTGFGDGGERVKGKIKAPPLDGLRYPPQGATSRKLFECPFHKHSPDSYYICEGNCMPRISDVTYHLKRRHLLLKVGMELGMNTKSEDIFHGFGAEDRLRHHLKQGGRCQEANIGQTGVLLTSEFEELKRELRLGFDETTKWLIIWRKCFSKTAPPSSPYVENTVSQARTSDFSSVNYPMAGNGRGLFASQSNDTGSLLTLTEPHIDTWVQTQAEQPAPWLYSTPAYTPSQDYNPTMPLLPLTFPSSSNYPHWAGLELIGGQAEWDSTALDRTGHFLDLGMHSIIPVQNAGYCDLDGLFPAGYNQYHDGYIPRWSANNQSRSQNKVLKYVIGKAQNP